MSFDFVSLVPRGDDPMAQVVISKADPALSINDKETDDMGVQINKSELAPEVVQYIEELESENDELSKALLEADDASIAKSDEAELLAKADPAVRRLIEAQNARLVEAENIAKAEKDARLEREFIAKAETLPNVGEDRSEFGGLLRRISESISKEDAEALDKVLTAANVAIEKSALFGEKGRAGEHTISASAQAAAEDIRKADPTLTIEQAQARAFEQNPDLFAEALNEEG